MGGERREEMEGKRLMRREGCEEERDREGLMVGGEGEG